MKADIIEKALGITDIDRGGMWRTAGGDIGIAYEVTIKMTSVQYYDSPLGRIRMGADEVEAEFAKDLA